MLRSASGGRELTIQAPWKDLLVEPLAGDHLVQLYRDDRSLVEAMALFAGPGIGKGEAVILVATPSHLEAFERRLERADFYVEGFKRWGQLTLIDAEELLSRFMVNGLPDATLFQAAIGDLIDKARAGGRYSKVRVYGEMVNLLWNRNLPAATRLEELWNEAIRTHSVSLLCAYCLERSDTEAPRQFPPGLRALHTHLIPVEAAA